VLRYAGTQVNLGTGVLANIEGSVTVNQAWMREINDRNGTVPNIIGLGAAAFDWTSASGLQPTLTLNTLQGSITVTGSPFDRFNVEGTPNSAYRTIIRNFSTSNTPNDVYVVGKNVMPLEITGNFNLAVGQRLNADGSVTALGQIANAFKRDVDFVPTGVAFNGNLLWQDFAHHISSEAITGGLNYGQYGNTTFVQNALPILFNYSGASHGNFIFDASAETVTGETNTIGLLNGAGGRGLDGISTNANYPGQAQLRFYEANVVYGPGIDVTWYAAKLRTTTNAINVAMPTLLDNPFASTIRYIANPTNVTFTPIEQVLIGNVLGPVMVEGSGRTTRVELNPLYSLPTSGDASLIIGNNANTTVGVQGWGTGHTGAYSLIDTIRAAVTVSNAALRIIADIPLPAGSPAVTSRPDVIVADDHITGIAGATINISSLKDSIFQGAGFFWTLNDLNFSSLPGLSVQLPAHASVNTTVEDTPSGATTHITTVLSSSNTTFTDGPITVLGTTGALVLGQLYGVVNGSNGGCQFQWSTTGNQTFATKWSDGISVSQINIGDGSLHNIRGPILLKGDSQVTTATMTNLDGRNDAARSNVLFTKSNLTATPIPTENSFYQQLDGFAPAPIYFGGFYQQPHTLNVYGSASSFYDVKAAPFTMKLYPGTDSQTIVRTAAVSVIGGKSVQLVLNPFVPLFGFVGTPEVSVEQDPAHPQLINIAVDRSDTFSIDAFRLESPTSGQMRLAATNTNVVPNTDYWRLLYKGSDARLTVNYGTISVSETGTAGTVLSSRMSTINVLSTSNKLQILPTGTGATNATVNLGQNGNLQNIVGDIEVSANTAMSLQLDDRNDSAHREVHLLTDVDGSTLVTGLSPGSIRQLTEVGAITIEGSAGGTIFHVDSQLYPVTSRNFSINGHGTLNNVPGTSDLVVGPNIANTWSIANPNFTFLNGNVVVRNVANLQGGSAHDAFGISGTSATLSGNIDGGDGVDSLYYYDGALNGTINLPNHSAPRIAGQVLNIEDSGVASSLVVNTPSAVSTQSGVPITPINIIASFGLGVKSYAATGLPTGVSINAQTGVISGTPSVANYTATVIVQVSDDSGSRSIGFSFSTTPGLSITPVPTQTTDIETAASLQIQTHTIFGGTLTYSATGLPAGLSINSQSGLISGTVTRGALHFSPYHAMVQVTDGTHTVSTDFTWNVHSTTAQNVVDFPHPSGVGIIEITAPIGTYFVSAGISRAAGVDWPAGFNFPVGFINFVLAGLTSGQAVDLTFTGIDTTNLSTYYKYGPTAVDPTNHWYDFRFVPQTDGTGMQIGNGNFVLHLVDGGRGDDDLTADGIIKDIGGPAATGVAAINHAPSFEHGPSMTSDDENSVTHGPALQTTIVAWAKNISLGPASDAGQRAMQFHVTTDNDSLFAVKPAIDADGNLRYTAAPNAYGTTKVTVTLQDDGGEDNGGFDTSEPQTFNITINKPHKFHNSAGTGDRNGRDVTGSTAAAPDGFIVAGDVLAIINYINAHGSGPVNQSVNAPPYVDVDADDNAVATDALIVINWINAHPSQSEGEASAFASTFSDPVVVDLNIGPITASPAPNITSASPSAAVDPFFNAVTEKEASAANSVVTAKSPSLLVNNPDNKLTDISQTLKPNTDLLALDVLFSELEDNTSQEHGAGNAANTLQALLNTDD
jgi:hypothetical protein